MPHILYAMCGVAQYSLAGLCRLCSRAQNVLCHRALMPGSAPAFHVDSDDSDLDVRGTVRPDGI